MKVVHKNTPLLTGLELQSREDGVWLAFTHDGVHSVINLSNYAKERGPITSKGMMSWLIAYATMPDLWKEKK
jgi:hypothetical protein